MDRQDQYAKTLRRAFGLGKRIHPAAPIEHHQAFANSVAFAMTGLTEGFRGPSMRERFANGMIIERFGRFNGSTRCSFEQAAELALVCCYGKITMAHARLLEGSCDNTAEDVAAAERLLAAI